MLNKFVTRLTEAVSPRRPPLLAAPPPLPAIASMTELCQELQDYLGIPLGFAGGILRDGLCQPTQLSQIAAYCWQLRYGKLASVLNLLTEFSMDVGPHPTQLRLGTRHPPALQPAFAFRFSWHQLPVTIYQFELPGSLQGNFDFFSHLAYQQPLGLNRVGYYRGILGLAPEFFHDQVQQHLTYYALPDEPDPAASTALAELHASYPTYSQQRQALSE